ncbi:MAG: GNAT family N-acetyltransferase [Solirubrobacteraceae bacterium]
MTGGARTAPHTQDRLALALALDRRVAIGGATETFAIPEGCVILNAELPDVHHLNEVVLDAPLPAAFDAQALVTLSDRWLAGVSHRFVRVDDKAGAERLVPELVAAGWERSRTVMMVRGAEAPPAPDPRARTITESEHYTVMLANLSAADYRVDAVPGLPRLLVDAQFAMLAGTPSLAFGAGEDGGLQSMCELFLDPDVKGVRMAMVEQVGTLPGYRERGLAKAVVGAAIAAARDWGAELIIVPADADDWPQVIYAGLGFEPVGTQVQFTSRGGRT